MEIRIDREGYIDIYIYVYIYICKCIESFWQASNFCDLICLYPLDVEISGGW